MKEISTTNKFKKDYLKIKQDKKFDEDEFKHTVEMIQNGLPLPGKYRDHRLSSVSPKPYAGARDFHLASNICVIYRIEKDAVVLIRIGSHQNLGLTESCN